MNHDEHPTDSVLTRELRDSLADLPAPERPPLAAIINRGRARRARRARFAGLGGTGVAAGTVVALGMTGVLAGTTAGGPGPARRAARNPGTIRTAAFTLSSNANGTDTLTLRQSQVLNPAELQRALARDHIPALVMVGVYCSSNPPPPQPGGGPGPGSTGVLSVRPFKPHPGLRPVPATGPAPNLRKLIDNTRTVINPAAMPRGTELFFTYANSFRAVFVGLIYTDAHTCRSGPPPTAP
jgi:hypothetical protein